MDNLEKNLKALAAQAPEVYRWLLEAEEDPAVELIRCRNGLLNLRLRQALGKSIALYDIEDPMAEEEVRCQSRSFGGGQVTFLIGIGLGYILEVIGKKQQKGHKTVVFEKNPTILKRALARADLSGRVESREVVFSLGTPENVIAAVSGFNETRVEVLMGAPRGLDGIEEYRQLAALASNHATQLLTLNAASVNAGPAIARNMVANLPKCFLASGIHNLLGRFAAMPGILVSAGPSLAKNIHRLKRAEGKALLLATAPVVRVLLAHDIKPDLMISTDFGESNRLHFEGLLDRLDIPLLCPPMLAANIVREFQGELFVFQQERGEEGLLNNGRGKGALPASGSVAGYGLKALIAFGCDPVIFVGQDLAFSDQTHIGGSARCRPLEERYGGEELIPARGIGGENVFTTLRFLSFLGDIENTVRMHSRLFLNATARGMEIKGTRWLPLPACLAAHCRRPVPAGDLIRGALETPKSDLQGFAESVETVATEFRQMADLCLQELKRTRTIRKKIDRGGLNEPGVSAAMRESDTNVARFMGLYAANVPLRFFLSGEMSRISREGYQAKGEETPSGRVRAILKRKEALFAAGGKALKSLAAELMPVLASVQKVEKIQQSLLTNPLDGFARHQLGKVWLEMGFTRLAVEELSRAIELGFSGGETLDLLVEANLRLGRLAESRELLRRSEISEAGPEFTRLRVVKIEEVRHEWLARADVCLQSGDWVNALLYVRKALREVPACERAKKIAEAARALRDEATAFVGAAGEKEGTEWNRKKACDLWIARGKEFFSRRDFPSALEAFQRAFPLAGRSAEIESLQAFCYSEMGEIGRTREILERLSAREPESGLPLFNLGRALIRNRQLREGAEKLEAAAQKDKTIYEGLFEAGTIFMQEKEYVRAIRCFEGFLERSPESYEVLVKIGTCHLAQGRVGEARGKYREALNFNPNYPAAKAGLERIDLFEKHRAAVTPVAA